MKTWQVILFSLLAGALAAGVILLVASPPRGQPIQLAAQPTPSPLIVYVTGAIRQPGVIALPAGSRVTDAIEAAGGLAPEADASGVNLAAPVHDGQHLVIPRAGEVLPTQPASATAAAQPGAKAPPATPTPAYTADLPLNLNTATQADLETLPSIGPTRAQAILAYREAHGAFARIEDLLNVPGIGPTLFERIKALITIE